MKAGLSEAGAPNRYPLPPLMTAGALVAAFILQWFAPIAWEGATFWRVLGAMVALCAIALMAWAAVHMRRRAVNILPHRAATGLVTDGPFAWSRNPIYLADVLVVAGLGVFFANGWMVMAAVVLAVLLRELAAKREERHMAERFGDEWHAYARKVRRWL